MIGAYAPGQALEFTRRGGRRLALFSQNKPNFKTPKPRFQPRQQGFRITTQKTPAPNEPKNSVRASPNGTPVFDIKNEVAHSTV